ncbi:unnamed protein product [Closterium sp. NIES-54]
MVSCARFGPTAEPTTEPTIRLGLPCCPACPRIALPCLPGRCAALPVRASRCPACLRVALSWPSACRAALPARALRSPACSRVALPCLPRVALPCSPAASLPCLLPPACCLLPYAELPDALLPLLRSALPCPATALQHALQPMPPCRASLLSRPAVPPFHRCY